MKKNRYYVMYPGGELSRRFDRYKDAYKCAVAVSKMYKCGIEIQRDPEPYQNERIVLAI